MASFSAVCVTEWVSDLHKIFLENTASLNKKLLVAKLIYVWKYANSKCKVTQQSVSLFTSGKVLRQLTLQKCIHLLFKLPY